MGGNYMNIENSLESIILGLADCIEKESQEKNKNLIDALYNRFNNNESLYECEMHLAYLNFAKFSAMPWISKNGIKETKNKDIISYIYTGLFNHFVRVKIEKAEGSACSGDKEHFTIKQVKKAIMTGENQSLYADYTGCDRIEKERWDNQAYWSPKVFKDTDEVIAEFWKWYRIE